jgi:hypothetical protein
VVVLVLHNGGKTPCRGNAFYVNRGRSRSGRITRLTLWKNSFGTIVEATCHKRQSGVVSMDVALTMIYAPSHPMIEVSCSRADNLWIMFGVHLNNQHKVNNRTYDK